MANLHVPGLSGLTGSSTGSEKTGFSVLTLGWQVVFGSKLSGFSGLASPAFPVR